jgi:chemotaxis protein histidine kinase CheA
MGGRSDENEFGTTFGQLATFLGHISLNLRKNIEKGGLEFARLSCNDEVMDWNETFFRHLSDMLVHALNNCVDHGYLFPKARGIKVSDAQIEVSARRLDNFVEVRIEDRGAGLDMPALLELAVRKNVDITDEPESILEVLFLDGASTAERVTMTSGRGVGLSAIRANARNLGGDAKIRNRTGGGSVLILNFPVELATGNDSDSEDESA